MSQPHPDETGLQRDRELIAAARRDSADLARASSPAPPREVIPGYTLVREIGRGGMGIVYEAEQQQPQRAVAVKMIRERALADGHRVRLFEREIETLARLRHPAIASIYEAGRTANGRHYYVMELVRGVPLTEYVRLHRLALAPLLRLFGRVCQAVHYAHQRGVIHRDLKPHNIIIDADGNPKILDFGLARLGQANGAIGTATAEVGKILGTLPYMSPEQARISPGAVAEIDVRTDVYGLGVILFELLTGELPYDVASVPPAEALRIICEEPPRRPRLVNRALRPDLETIVLKALAKEPARRYDSPAALAEDIERFLADQPIRARPPSTAYLLAKWLARHRSTVPFVAVLVVVIAAFLVLLRIQSLEISRARHAMELAQRPVPAAAQWAVDARLRETARQLEQSAEELLANRNFLAAEPVLRACLDLRRDVHGPAHGLTAYVESLLGGCLTRLGRYEEAEPLLLHSYAVIARDRGAGRERKLEARERVLGLYNAWGRRDDGVRRLAELDAALAAESDAPATRGAAPGDSTPPQPSGPAPAAGNTPPAPQEP